jgi:hypothetical protein
MESKPLVLLVVGIVAGAVVGFGGGFAVYNSQIVDLKGSLTDTQLQYITLSSQYQVLSTQKDKLLANYTALSSQEKSLSDSYNQLQVNYGQLHSNYGNLNTFLGGLSNDVSSLNETLYSMGFLPKAFSRTLNSQEIGTVTNIVSNIDQSEPDPLSAYGNIYAYVNSFATAVNEVSFPYLRLSTSVVNGTRYISGFDAEYHEVYLRTPTETIKFHEGNAVDQAVLQYAMMINYQQNIKKVSQDIYLGSIDFQDGTQGSAVFVPSQNGLLTIFDPAANYMTHEFQTSNRVAARLAASEMGAYYNSYDSQKKTIVNFTLYKINTVDGSVANIVKGQLSDIIAFFSG